MKEVTFIPYFFCRHSDLYGPIYSTSSEKDDQLETDGW